MMLVETRTGGYSLKIEGENGSERLLHSLYDPEAEARGLVDRLSFDGGGILAVVGLGLGYHVAEAARRFPEALVVVVEADPAIAETARRVGPLRELEERIVWLVGLDEAEVVREITRHQVRRGMAPLGLLALPAAVSSFPGHYEPLLARLERIRTARLWERIKYPKFRADSLRVVLLDFGYHLTREIQAAVRGLGHEIASVPVREGEHGEDLVARLMARILELRPDFLITLNHLGFDEDGVLTSFLRAIEMPVACWYVDSPDLIVKGFSGNVSPFTHLFLWDRGYIEGMRGMGFEQAVYLPLATDTRVFKPAGPGPGQTRFPGCEVGFVGSSMVDPVAERLGKVGAASRPLVETLARGMLAGRDSFAGFLAGRPPRERELVESLAPRERMDIEAAVIWRVTQLYRLSCVQGMSGFDARVHGDPGWKKLLRGTSIRVSPPLRYHEDLPGFYRACGVNLNATSLQMAQAVNQRVFDVPACGGFLLTDHQPGLDELFDVGTEVIVYRDPGEIPDLLRHYLDRPAERQAVVRRGRERVLAEHTYRHRLAAMIRCMRERFGC